MPGRSDLPGDEAVEAGAGANVHEALAGLEAAQRKRVGDPCERLDGSFRQRIEICRVVAKTGGETAAGVEVVVTLGVGRRLAVLVADVGRSRAPSGRSGSANSSSIGLADGASACARWFVAALSSFML
jgi:hypothetical protein